MSDRAHKYVIIAIVLFAYLMIATILLFPLVARPGIPFAGDETYYAPPRISDILYSWSQGGRPYIPIEVIHRIISIFLIKVLGLEIAIKVWLILVSALPGITMFIAMKKFLEYFRVSIDHSVLASFVGGLLYMVAFTNPGPLYAAQTESWPYLIFPLLMLYIIKYLNEGRILHLFVLGILILLGNPQPITLIFTLILPLAYLLLRVFVKRDPSLSRIIRRTILILLIMLSLNSYWILPNLIGYIKGFSFAQVYSTEILISYDSLRFLSHWKLLDVLVVGEGPYYFFWMHPRNYTLLNFLIPISAGIGILAYRKNKGVLFVAILLVLGIFLTKGVWPPGGIVYYHIASLIPYFGAYLRNPTKFVPLVVSSYAILSTLGMLFIMEKLKKAIGKRRSELASLTLTCLMLLTLAHGTLLDLKVQSWRSYSPTYVPEVYYVINNWLIEDPENFKVLWIPVGGAYLWKPYLITGFPALLSSKPAVDFGKIYPNPLEDTDEIGELLRVLGVKYVIYHGDSISYPSDKILDYLVKQRDLEVVYKANYTFRPEDNSRAPIPRGVEGFSFSNSPFELISPSYLPRGEEVTLVLKYRIPDEVVAKGFKGEFSIDFNISLEAYEAGYTTPDKSVAWSAAYKQEMVNEISGYAYFKIKIPYNYPGTAVDLYAWFYDRNFMMLTPRYFLGRLLVEPSTIEVPFIVFENEDYSGPVYVTRLAVAYGLDTIDVLSSKFISTRDYSVLLINPNAEVDDKLKRVLEHADLIVYPCLNATPPWMEEVMSSRNIRVACILPLGHLKLPLEKPVEGPKETKGPGYISVHLINSTLVLKAYIPKDGTYLLYLRAKGDLKVNNIQPACGMTSNACYVKLQLRRGYNDVMISTPNEAYIYAIGLVSAPNNTQQNTGDVGAVVEYREVSPVKWEVTVNTSKPFVLVFTEPYDRMWRAYINGKEIEPIPIYNLVNGFMINETGLLRIDIYYTLQTYYVLGTIITSVTMIGLILLTLRERITLY